MPDIYCSTFKYGATVSSTYGLVLSNVNTSRIVQTSGVIEGLTVFNRKHAKRYLVGDNYANSPLSFDVDITTKDGALLTPAQERAVHKWLFNKPGYQKLYLDWTKEFGDMVEIVDGAQKQLYLNARFVNPIKLEYNGGVVGYQVTLEADSNMFWQDSRTLLNTVNLATTTAQTNITITVDTDSKDYIYPITTIQMGTLGGEALIINNSDNTTRETKVTTIAANGQVILNGETNMVSSNYYEKFYKSNFVRFVDGTNNLLLKGNIKSVTFTFSQRRLL